MARYHILARQLPLRLGKSAYNFLGLFLWYICVYFRCYITNSQRLHLRIANSSFRWSRCTGFPHYPSSKGATETQPWLPNIIVLSFVSVTCWALAFMSMWEGLKGDVKSLSCAHSLVALSFHFPYTRISLFLFTNISTGRCFSCEVILLSVACRFTKLSVNRLV